MCSSEGLTRSRVARLTFAYLTRPQRVLCALLLDQMKCMPSTTVILAGAIQLACTVLGLRAPTSPQLKLTSVIGRIRRDVKARCKCAQLASR